MPEQHLYEYAVIRVVPRVEREEFLNVGVVVYCATQKCMHILFTVDKERLKAFAGELDIEEIEAHLKAFELICKGDPAGGPIARMPLAERFRWLTAVRSTVVQTSRVHPGFCTDPETMLKRLHEELVL